MSDHQRVLPLETLFAQENGERLPLPAELTRIFGAFHLPLHAEPAYVIGNVVTSLDGVVTLNVRGHVSGGDISGFNRQDQALVGLLRAAADVVIIGAGTMRVEQGNLLTPAMIAPWLHGEYQELRTRLGKHTLPWNVIISASGNLDLTFPAFQSGAVPVLVITTARGRERLEKQQWGPSTQVVAVRGEDGAIPVRQVLEAVAEICGGHLWLVEGGPRVFGDFIAEAYLDELFLTLAPQIAGRAEGIERPGLVEGKLFAPDHPHWGRLAALRRGENHLFLRYKLKTG